MSFNPYPDWTPNGSFLDGLDRQTEWQKEIMRSSLATTETTISQDAPIIIPDSPFALCPTPSPASRPPALKPFKFDPSTLPWNFGATSTAPEAPKFDTTLWKLDTTLWNFEATSSTAAKRGSFWSRLKRWLW